MGLSWYIQRLRAMSAGEVAWRFGQKRLSVHERRAFSKMEPVYAVDAYGRVSKANLSRLGIDFTNGEFSVGADIELLGGYRYSEYRKRWHAAFQSPGDWPMRFAADYAFGDEGAPGDIRTNWELNRHRQFALLAKSYFVTGTDDFFSELSDLFDDWNEQNPFMWGPEWASPMEESIRLINWLVTAAFLGAAGDEATDGLRRRLCVGAWVMAAHVRQHYSRHSSANNHTIVEAAGVAVAATVFGEHEWLDEALALLESEVAHQTYLDGVNKEQALHYQLFVMEALCLVSHVLRTIGKALPASLVERLRSMARYARACSVGSGKYVEFGDDDEGVILCLGPEKPCYPDYVLALVTLELESDYRWVEDVRCCETVGWLYGKRRLQSANALPLTQNASVESFPDGGVTIVRFDEGRGVLAFDHGPLGFGRLAAHGHADALSVQLYVDGEPVLVDPGTFIYNGDRRMRDKFRSTCVHNTMCVGGRDQSEALGPFLWGRKANVSGFAFEECEGRVIMSAEHDGYSPVCVRRTVKIQGAKAVVTDEVKGGEAAAVFWHLPSAGVEVDGGAAEFRLQSGVVVRIEAGGSLESGEFEYSPDYGMNATGVELSVSVNESLTTGIFIIRDSEAG
mgnify:FL=1